MEWCKTSTRTNKNNSFFSYIWQYKSPSWSPDLHFVSRYLFTNSLTSAFPIRNCFDDEIKVPSFIMVNRIGSSEPRISTISIAKEELSRQRCCFYLTCVGKLIHIVRKLLFLNQCNKKRVHRIHGL